MMSSNELFYGDNEPVWVADSAAYPMRRGRYAADKYYRSGSGSGGAGYYREPSYSRMPSDYYSTDRYDYDGYRYSSDLYRSGSPTSVYGAAYDQTYYDSRPNEYYDYRRPSTIVLRVPICCEGCCEEARNALFELHGVRAVYCDVRRERITVTGTVAPADVVQVLRKLHKKARIWGDEDYYY